MKQQISHGQFREVQVDVRVLRAATELDADRVRQANVVLTVEVCDREAQRGPVPEVRPSFVSEPDRVRHTKAVVLIEIRDHKPEEVPAVEPIVDRVVQVVPVPQVRRA